MIALNDYTYDCFEGKHLWNSKCNSWQNEVVLRT